MDENLKSLYVARLTSGQQRFRHDGNTYLLKNPTPEQLLIVEEYMYEYKQDMESDEVLSRQKLLMIMKKNGLWSDEEEKEIGVIKKQIDDLKISLFESRYKSVQQKIIKNNINTYNQKLDELNSKRYALDNLSIEGNIFATRMRLLFGMCIYNRGGQTYWNDQEDFSEWDLYDPTIDSLFANYVKSKISPKEVRFIARTDPWTTYWSMKSHTGGSLFSSPVMCLSDEQRSLISWSNTYDFINNLQGADKLSDFIIEDDDMLDGWILIYNKANKRESYGTDNFGKGDEVFIMVDTIEDAKRIHEMNDPITRLEIQKEMAMIDERGTLSEMERPSYQKKHNAAYAEACRIKGVM